MKFSNLLPELPFPQPSLSKTFTQLHERYLEQFPNWSLLATRRKLVVSYWLKIILNHYGFLMIAGSLLVLLFTKTSSLGADLFPMALASVLAFFILFISMYWPIYQMEFLPHLDNCMEAYKGKQLEGIQECKKNQYSVITLMLIQHIFQQLSGINPVLINKENTQLLSRQYGVSVKSVGNSLQLILRGDWDRKSIRKRTEILDDFDSARDHFQQLSCDKAIKLLDLLQEKILQSPLK